MPALPTATRALQARTTPTDALALRLRGVSALLGMLTPAPQMWLKRGLDANQKSKGGTNGGLACLPCYSYQQLVVPWRKALKWTDGLDHALTVMLASVTSTKSVGDQLWIKVIGPAACGKSTLCEAISVCSKYIFAKSTIRGFHSGYRLDHGRDDEDNSLVPLIRDKTLVTKDGDTLLRSPNLPQILSEARDLYDGTSRTHYRNRTSKDYSGVHMTWLLCGTSSLRAIDSSELGERFLDCVIMDGIDNELEDEVLWRVANRAQRNVSVEADGKPDTQYPEELVQAFQLTGGYVEYLRENAADLLSQIEPSKSALVRCTKLGKFVAFMRARPSRLQEEASEREFGTRLVEQHVRLANCLAVVLNKKTLDKGVMRRVTRVATDTARGCTLDIATHLYAAGDKGAEVRGIAMATNRNDDRARRMLRFLRQIAVVEPFTTQSVRGIKGNVRWRLTERVRGLYRSVLDA